MMTEIAEKVPFFVEINDSSLDKEEDYVYIGLVPFSEREDATTLLYLEDEDLWDDTMLTVSTAKALQIVYERGALALARCLGFDLECEEGAWVKTPMLSGERR